MTNKAPHPTPVSVHAKPKKVFVVSPIGVPGTEVYQKAAYALKYIFRQALTDDKWDVHRADEGKSPDSIGQHVIKKLYEADLVIADLTGHNPNVFYELAIAHGWRKPVVHLIAKGEKVPFDIVDQRTIFYDITDLASVEDAIETLREYAEYALEHADKLVTPLTSFEMFNQIRVDDADGGAAVAGMLEQVVSRLSRIESRMSGGGDFRRNRQMTPELREQFDRTAARYAALDERIRMLSGEHSRGMPEAREEVLRMHAEMDALLEGLSAGGRREVLARAAEYGYQNGDSIVAR